MHKKYLAPFLFLLLFFPSISDGQVLSLDINNAPNEFTNHIFQIIAVITVLSLAPSLLILTTSFTRFVIVFSFLRNALGTQQSPPNMVLISLALFLTFFIMNPVFKQSYEQGIKPYMNNQITLEEALPPITKPFHAFMIQHTRPKDIALFSDIAQETPKDLKDISFSTLVPAFVISELRKAFEIGFLLFIPFLVIDLVVASVLMSMGMMMIPPVMISLPFKIIFFVLVDGWYMVVGSLIKGFETIPT